MIWHIIYNITESIIDKFFFSTGYFVFGDKIFKVEYIYKDYFGELINLRLTKKSIKELKNYFHPPYLVKNLLFVNKLFNSYKEADLYRKELMIKDIIE
jgi:hypothetical protein